MIIFHIPGPLREFTRGEATIKIDDSPATLAGALAALWTRYPGLRDRVLTEQGQIREHINVFIGDQDIRYLGGLATPVTSGSEILIVPSISGGVSDRTGRTHIRGCVEPGGGGTFDRLI